MSPALSCHSLFLSIHPIHHSVYAFFAPEIGKLFFPAGTCMRAFFHPSLYPNPPTHPSTYLIGNASMRAVRTFMVFAGNNIMF